MTNQFQFAPVADKIAWTAYSMNVCVVNMVDTSVL